MRWTERQRSMIEAMGIRLHSLPSAGLELHEAREAGEAGEAREAREAMPVVSPHTAQAAPARPPEPLLPIAPATERDHAIAHMDWPALRAAVAGCRACGLCESRKNTVFGVGHERSHWMIVGEAPGENEDLQGEPFVGAAGALLDNMLRALGLTRQADAAGHTPDRQVFIANTLKCRPPRNRNPDPAETARCAPYLVRQIELVQPRVLLAMGRFAAQSLLQTDEPIGRLRGRVHRWRDTPVVVTYHPAYLLRTLADKARAWEDLCLAASVVQRHEA
jgi:uracil-DNA glycosylase